MSGFETARQLRKSGADVKIVFLTLLEDHGVKEALAGRFFPFNRS